MSKYLPELDGLRAISVLLVITAHMHQKVWHWASGGLGVVVFFVLSGYLITSLAMAEQQASGGVDLKAFYIRRAFRIFPLYYIVLATYCALIFGVGMGGAEKAVGLREALPYYVTYFQEIPYFSHWSIQSLPFFQSWSLGIEEKFYLVWPVLAFVVFRSSARFLAAVLIAASVLCCFFAPAAMFVPYSSILVGCLFALVRYQYRRSLLTVLLPMGALQFAAVPLTTGPINSLLTFLYACLAALLISSLTHRSNAFLSWKPLTWVGKVSYGVYLIHLFCIPLAERLASNPLAAFCLAALLSIGLASVLHVTIERPLIQLGRRYSTHAAVTCRTSLT